MDRAQHEGRPLWTPTHDTLMTSARRSGRQHADDQILTSSPAESQMWIAAYSILLLSVGVSLQVSRFIKLQQEEHPEQDTLDEFVYSDGFSLISMLLSIVWIVVVIAYSIYENRKQQTQGSDQPVHHVGNYLIYGLCFFAMGGEFLALFHAMALFTYTCSSPVSKAYAVIKIIFIALQVVLIAWCRKQSVFSKHLINGIFLYHTVTTNVVLYLTTFLESKIGFPRRESSNLTVVSKYLGPSSHVNCTLTNDNYHDLFHDASLYLYPFCLEFTLTSSAMLAEYWIAAKHYRESNNLILAFPTVQSNISTSNRETGNGRKLNLAIPTIIGLTVFGLFVLMIILLHYLSRDNNPGNVFQVFNISVSAIAKIVCLTGLILLKSNDAVNSNVSLDEVLLITTIFGTFGISLCLIYSAISGLVKDGDNDLNSYAVLMLTASLSWILQAFLQSNFIVKALNRKPREVKFCCGIFNIAYLALILAYVNFGMWLLDTIDLEGHDNSVYSNYTLLRLNILEDNFFGKSTWTWVMLVLYPLAIFFRIHSVSTLYRVYKLHKYVPTDTDQK
ncbi:proton channel OtopLc-like [Corticium candelabrum]|uniref:proton channel OtopLc-like n=1 Tax=Corticium candelabrum TaxID=121492 RepID=UPI002E253777|nr:proton channel OtopLc-like [Corticium candelabrum]